PNCWNRIRGKLRRCVSLPVATAHLWGSATPYVHFKPPPMAARQYWLWQRRPARTAGSVLRAGGLRALRNAAEGDGCSYRLHQAEGVGIHFVDGFFVLDHTVHDDPAADGVGVALRDEVRGNG